MLSKSASSGSHPVISSASRRQRQSAAIRIPRTRIERISLSRAIKLLRQHAVAISAASGDTIFSEGDNAANIYIVERGVVRLCMKTLQSGRIISDFMLAHDPLGAIEKSSYAWTAEAATDVDLLQISKGDAGDLLGRSGNMNVLSSQAWQLAADAWRLQKAMEEQAPNRRLACFLIRFSQRTNTPIGRPMRLGISHRDIACHLGLSEEELEGSIVALTREHVIDTRDTTCTILDTTAVIELALQAVLPNGAPKWHRTSPDMTSILA